MSWQLKDIQLHDERPISAAFDLDGSCMCHEKVLPHHAVGTLFHTDMHHVCWYFIRSLPCVWQRWKKTLQYPWILLRAAALE